MAEQVNEAAVLAALTELTDPETGRSVVETGQVRDVRVSDSAIALTFGLSTHSAILRDETHERLKQLLAARFPSHSISITPAIESRPPEAIGQIGLTVKSVVAVGSGKGGVGKSTIAASIALGLAAPAAGSG